MGLEERTEQKVLAFSLAKGSIIRANRSGPDFPEHRHMRPNDTNLTVGALRKVQNTDR